MSGGDGVKRTSGAKRRRIAIVGAGFSGAVLAAQLLRLEGKRPEVTLIERGRRFGPGLAYGAADRAHLLNVRASNMSAFPDAPDDFVRWLKRRGGGESASFASRARYGEYVEHVLRAASGARWFSGGGLRKRRAEAIACQPHYGGWRVALSVGPPVDADAVVLALGNPAPANLPVLQDVRVANPWDAAVLRRVPRNSDVLLIGTGLTMIDVALSLERAGRVRTIYALSRRGLSPRPHAPSETVTAQGLPQALSEALHEVRARGGAENWRGAIEQLRPHTRALWEAASLETQMRFLRHLRPWWDVHRHRNAPEIAARIDAMKASGRLRILAGELVSASPGSRGGVQILHRQRGSHVRHRLDVSCIFNCTGANLDVRTSDNALLSQILDDGIARPHANGLGLDVDPEGRVLRADGIINSELFALGPITQGAFWECTAVPEIRVNAAALAQSLR